MNRIGNVLNILLVILFAGLIMACGKSTEEEKSKTSGQAAESKTEESVEDQALSISEAPFQDVLAQAGYKATLYRRIPSPISGKKGSVVLYQKDGKGKEGGILYFEEKGEMSLLVWHWYFDRAPVSIAPDEINGDGLWDLRVKTKDGKQLELIHDGTFTLTGGEREGHVALNGEASAPTDPKFPLWHCFDRDTTTVWNSNIGDKNKAYIELPTPFGVSDGILTVWAQAGYEPRHCELRVNGKSVQRFELRKTTDEQLVRLDPKVRTAETVRLVIATSHGGGKVTGISELGIK